MGQIRYYTTTTYGGKAATYIIKKNGTLAYFDADSDDVIGARNVYKALEEAEYVQGRSFDIIKEQLDSSEHLLTLINDVLDISRIESGKMQFSPVPVDITEVADTVANVTSGFLSNRNITFQCKLEQPQTPYVLADALHIREVLVNILGTR